MKKNFLVILAIFTLFALFSRGCGGGNTSIDTTLAENDLGLATNKIEYAYGKEVKVTLKNNFEEDVLIVNDCPSEPLDVFKYKNGEWLQMEATYELECVDQESYTILPGEELNLSYQNWTYGVFDEIGRYQIRYELDGKTFSSNEFTITEAGLFTKFWREVFYKPIYNALVYVISVLPSHSLALAIILVTLLIRTILLVPSQQAIRSQKKMQDIQPKLEEIKRKYKGNQEKIAMETMRVWQDNKANPLGSCLPLLIQFPILIALFYTVKDGLEPDKVAFLYEFQKDFSLELINPSFLGIFDLTKIDIYVFPIAVGLLQFTQMKLSLSRKKKKTDTKKPAKKEKQQKPNEMEQANKMMQYFMPLMIAFFTASVPSGVGLYWGTSTTYGIIQQIIVNNEKDKGKATVKVVDKT